MKHLKIIAFITLAVVALYTPIKAQKWVTPQSIWVVNAYQDTLDVGLVVCFDSTRTQKLAKLDSLNVVTHDSTTGNPTYLDTLRARMGSASFLYATPMTTTPNADTVVVWGRAHTSPIYNLYEPDAESTTDTFIFSGASVSPLATENGYAFVTLDSIKAYNGDKVGADSFIVYGQQALGVTLATWYSQSPLGIVGASSPTDSVVKVYVYGPAQAQMDDSVSIEYGEMVATGKSSMVSTLIVPTAADTLVSGVKADYYISRKVGWYMDAPLDTAVTAEGTLKYIFVDPR